MMSTQIKRQTPSHPQALQEQGPAQMSARGLERPASQQLSSGDFNAGLADEVCQIETSGLEELRRLWARRHGAPPTIRSVPILRMMLAWRLQTYSLGGLDEPTRRAVARKGPIRAEGLNLGIGARLTRNWKGREVEVVVEADGFRFHDRVFPSLSAAATAIAGSRWNGPRFFGLRGAA